MDSTPFIHFDNILNFRKADLNRVYRSGHIDDASAADLDKLAHLNIHSEIDLRTPEETLPNRFKGLQSAIAKRLRFFDLFFPKLETKLPKEKLLRLEPPKFTGERDVIGVNIFNIKYRRNAVWNRLSTKQKFSLAKFLLSFNKDGIERFVGKEILSPRGLIGLYKDIIDFSGDSLRATLVSILSELQEHNGNILVHCSWGRDRTGLIIYLLRNLMEHDVESIFNEYHLSESAYTPELRDRIVAILEDDGLTADFAKTPKEVISEVHNYILQKFGSVENYLLSIKITPEQIENLRKTLE